MISVSVTSTEHWQGIGLRQKGGTASQVLRLRRGMMKRRIVRKRREMVKRRTQKILPQKIVPLLCHHRASLGDGLIRLGREEDKGGKKERHKIISFANNFPSEYLTPTH